MFVLPCGLFPGFRFVLVIPKILRVVIDVKAVIVHFHVGYFFSATKFFGYFLSVDTGKFFVFFEFVKERTIVAFRAFPYPFGNDAVCDFSDSASFFGRLLVSCNQGFDIPSVKRYLYPLHGKVYVFYALLL